MNIDVQEHESVVERKGIGQRFLRTETHDAYGGLQKAIERSKQGKGTVVFCSHNAANDMFGALLLMKNTPQFTDKEFVLPMSSMMYKRYWPGETLLGVTFIPVHSPEVKRKHALAKKKNPKPTLKELSIMDRLTLPKEAVLDSEATLQRYLAASKSALEHGGVVMVAAQAQGNLDKLDMTHQRKAFSKFLNYMNQYPQLEYSLLPMGVSYPRLAQLGRPQKGAHFGERMRIDVGNCFDRADVSHAIAESGADADLWMYTQIAALLPKQAVKRE